MVYQPQTHARPYEPSQREIEASDAEVQRFLDDPEAADVDWETYAAGYKWGPDFMRYFNEALAANGERTDGVYGDRGLEAWHEAGLQTPVLVPASASGGQFKAFAEIFALFERV